jgi:hypothetical protein
MSGDTQSVLAQAQVAMTVPFADKPCGKYQRRLESLCILRLLDLDNKRDRASSADSIKIRAGVGRGT